MNFYKDNFKRFRESKGKTLEEIAKACGLSKQAVEHWEYGNCKPKPINVKRIAKFLNISVVDISDLKPEEELKSKLNDPDSPCIKLCEGMHEWEIDIVKRFKELETPDKMKISSDIDILKKEELKNLPAKKLPMDKAG